MRIMNKILVTGGAGYIGSHVALALLKKNYEIIVLDNLSNSHEESLVRIAKIAGRSLVFEKGDVRDRIFLDNVFSKHKISAVLHFAGLKAVNESVVHPLSYYANNFIGTMSLCEAMAAADVFVLVFSSSATVYGAKVAHPLREDDAVGVPTNPYGRSKLMVEQALCDLAAADSRWRFAILRYFNPVGAHESGLIGEDPNSIPNNLVPYISQVAVGKLPQLSVFGDDYLTHDGTGVRDYIHVVDLAEGHLRALDALNVRQGFHVWNIGTGKGYSVIDVVRAFEAASGRKIPYKIVPRRAGDIAEYYADPSKAARELGWQAQRGLTEMMQDAWRWQSNNPDGYRKKGN